VTAPGTSDASKCGAISSARAGTRLAVLRDPIVLEPTYDLTGDESLSLRLSASSPSYAALAERRVLRIVRKAPASRSWEEWRVSGRGESSGFTSPPSDFSGRPVRFDLGDVILRTQSLNDGTTAFPLQLHRAHARRGLRRVHPPAAHRGRQGLLGPRHLRRERAVR
jgi:hypothetical protein